MLKEEIDKYDLLHDKTTNLLVKYERKLWVFLEIVPKGFTESHF